MHPRYLMTGTRVWNLSHTITVKGAKIVDGKLNVQVIHTDASASSVSVTTIGFESTVVKACIMDNKIDRETATTMISSAGVGRALPQACRPPLLLVALLDVIELTKSEHWYLIKAPSALSPKSIVPGANRRGVSGAIVQLMVESQGTDTASVLMLQAQLVGQHVARVSVTVPA